jgi:hypothetical protein
MGRSATAKKNNIEENNSPGYSKKFEIKIKKHISL